MSKNIGKRIKAAHEYFENATDEDRQRLQKIVGYYDSASTEEREGLSHFIEVRKFAREAKENIVAPAGEERQEYTHVLRLSLDEVDGLQAALGKLNALAFAIEDALKGDSAPSDIGWLFVYLHEELAVVKKVIASIQPLPAPGVDK